MDDMNDFRLWDEAIRCIEQLNAAVDLKDYGLGALGTTCYEQLMIIVYMNDFEWWP